MKWNTLSDGEVGEVFGEMRCCICGAAPSDGLAWFLRNIDDHEAAQLLVSTVSEQGKGSVVAEQFTLAAQRAIAELRKEGLLTLDLTAHQVSHTGAGDSYTVYFFDSELFSVAVNWKPGESFKDLVRTAVLEELGKGHGKAAH